MDLVAIFKIWWVSTTCCTDKNSEGPMSKPIVVQESLR